MRGYFSFLFFSTFVFVIYSAPQYTDNKDQFEESNHTDVIASKNDPKSVQTNIIDDITLEEKPRNAIAATKLPENPTKSLTSKIYAVVAAPLVKLYAQPKVNAVIRNIGTCIVNGAMELISYYFPAPLIPLIASAAGMFIPFEPIVMLKQKMPVTSYRRAFRTAYDTFMGTFDRYKLPEEDPYMTRRFNRRFMGDTKEKKGSIEMDNLNK